MRSRPTLIFNEHPLVVSPTLACAIGLEQAIFVQQIHYWLDNNRRRKQVNEACGLEWIYNTQKEWREQFPFWTQRQMQYVISKAVEQGVILTMRPEGQNRRTWYTINDDFVDELEAFLIANPGGVQDFQYTKLYNGESGVPMPESGCTGFAPIYKNVSCNIQNCIMYDKESETTTDITDSRKNGSANFGETLAPQQPPQEPEAEATPAPVSTPSRKGRKPKEETRLFNDVKGAWFTLADSRTAAGKRAPAVPVAPKDFKQFKLSITALDEIAKRFNWTHEETVAYVIEVATRQLDSDWWRNKPLVAFQLRHVVDALQGWWTNVKKPEMAQHRAPAPAPASPPPQPFAHAERVARENRKRIRAHQQTLDNQAELGEAPLGYRPSRKNPFQRE